LTDFENHARVQTEWLKYCGAAGKSVVISKRREESQPVVSEETGLLDQKNLKSGGVSWYLVG
jgi:hypothetical protein